MSKNVSDMANPNYQSPHKLEKKAKKGPKADSDANTTYCFNIDLGRRRSSENYVFNWLDLVAEKEEKEKGVKAAKTFNDGLANLDPYASDDEDQVDRAHYYMQIDLLCLLRAG
jgi:hypothetical protein